MSWGRTPPLPGLLTFLTYIAALYYYRCWALMKVEPLFFSRVKEKFYTTASTSLARGQPNFNSMLNVLQSNNPSTTVSSLPLIYSGCRKSRLSFYSYAHLPLSLFVLVPFHLTLVTPTKSTVPLTLFQQRFEDPIRNQHHRPTDPSIQRPSSYKYLERQVFVVKQRG
jgi:hypothetical protein